MCGESQLGSSQVSVSPHLSSLCLFKHRGQDLHQLLFVSQFCGLYVGGFLRSVAPSRIGGRGDGGGWLSHQNVNFPWIGLCLSPW